jgi:hypothetical protein
LTPAAVSSQTLPYPPSPFWESAEPNATRSVAVGDIDLDGDLDLVCGNFIHGNTLFLNRGGTFGTSNPFPAADFTRSVALGDVDGDGDLDLVCGNFDGTNTLYLNTGGVFGQAAVDTFKTSNTAETIVLGDVDGDMDLDIVCGIQNEPNAVFLNNAGHFPPTPDWIIGGSNDTKSVALGDVDANGYVDLVCGNFGENRLYLNKQGLLDSIPSWSSGDPNPTRSVALGDIDGDGALDLVCGNFDQANAVYFNNGTLFETMPTWVSIPTGSTMTVDLGDVDNDGDIDLICGNQRHPNTLYLNDAGTLATDPIWYSEPTNKTTAVALGDLDGDGDLDLVCGNSDEVNTVYINQTGPFETAPFWVSVMPQPNLTKSVALGDVDNDGDLDLACGNVGANTFYPNEAGQFADTPTWSSSEQRPATSVAMAKVNRDGLIDLVCGNEQNPGEINTVYENNGTPFTLTSTWLSGPDKATTSIDLGDVNGDGLTDLVCGNGLDSNTVYLNLGSSFDTQPGWRSRLALATSGVALGDVNRDGDLDLVCGNNGEANTLYLNQGVMLATDPAWFSSLTLSTNDVALGDVDGDGDLDLACANFQEANTVYMNKGGVFEQTAAWSSRAPARATTSVALGDLDGDGDLDLVCGNAMVNLVGQPNTAYMNEGNMFARGPIWVSGQSNDTEDVVLGDVDADGDLDAVFGNENASNTLYRGNKNPPYRGDPSNPTHHLANNSPYLRGVSANQIGPNTHRVTFGLVDVESDPVWILAEYQFEGDPTWSPADVDGQTGKAGVFSTAPTAKVDSVDWDTSRVPSDRRRIVMRLTPIEIPRRVSSVQHAASYLIDIGRIPLIDTFARPSAGSEFFETRDIIVTLQLPPGANRDQAKLFFRRGGEQDYQEAAFEDGTPLPFATISSVWIGARGIEYWVEAQTSSGTLTDPRTNPSERPRTIRITVTNLEEDRQHAARRYRLMSIPLGLEGASTMIRALADDIGFPGPLSWRMFGYDAADTAYVDLPNDSVRSFEHGRGYWLITSGAHKLDTAPVFGTSAATDTAFTRVLEPGWNLIGQPFAFAVTWDSVLLASFVTTEIGSTIVEAPVAWDGDHYTAHRSVVDVTEQHRACQVARRGSLGGRMGSFDQRVFQGRGGSP